MIITVTDFEKASDISRNTIYSWFYRDVFPPGINKIETIGEIRLLEVTEDYKDYNRVSKTFKKLIKQK